jgi:hypothetical protein
MADPVDMLLDLYELRLTDQAEHMIAQAVTSTRVLRPLADPLRQGENPCIRSANPVADGTRGRCYLDGEWSPSKPRVARLKMLASSRC